MHIFFALNAPERGSGDMEFFFQGQRTKMGVRKIWVAAKPSCGSESFGNTFKITQHPLT